MLPTWQAELSASPFSAWSCRRSARSNREPRGASCDSPHAASRQAGLRSDARHGRRACGGAGRRTCRPSMAPLRGPAAGRARRQHHRLSQPERQKERRKDLCPGRTGLLRRTCQAEEEVAAAAGWAGVLLGCAEEQISRYVLFIPPWTTVTMHSTRVTTYQRLISQAGWSRCNLSV